MLNEFAAEALVVPLSTVADKATATGSTAALAVRPNLDNRVMVIRTNLLVIAIAWHGHIGAL
jgi:hypothetical protein